jgi:general secretion pathway protein A
MRQLDQRIARRCELQPLAAHEVRRYIERRLGVAHRLSLLDEPDVLQPWDADVETAPDVSFTPSAIREVAMRSGGVPRLVNLLCDRALEIASTRHILTIDARIVRAAARRVDIGTRRRSRIP